jgi:DNA repair protein RecN (Recombination protein N)
MLLRLVLRDFVIVDAADIELAPGFTVLSGETGAGKSILIDALGLALGGRADATFVRESAARAEISAAFSIGPDTESWLSERELTGDAGSLLLRRIVEGDGRSKAFVNGHPTTAAQLRELGDRLIDVHGQHSTQSLMRADGQRELLDACAGLHDETAVVSRAHGAWRALSADLEAVEKNDRELSLERDRLEWQVGELSQLKLAAGEWEDLNLEQKRLAHAAALIEAASGALEALTDSDEAVTTRVVRMLQKLRPLAAVDSRLSSSIELLEAASIQLDEAASNLSSYADRVELDPKRLEEVERRIGAVFSAARKFKLAPESLAAELSGLTQRLAQLDASRDIDGLRRRLAQARADYDSLAGVLSDKRKAAAKQLAQGVTRNIRQLGMSGGKLEVAIDSIDPTSTGVDRIEFRIASHAGATPRSLAKIASGGELSRIGLAIAVLAAQANPVPTLIFDEADSGVGGAIAEVIGGLMRKLGESRQVLCVTHLPQVAAKAHQHFAVTKESRGTHTVSRISALDRGARIEEIARMLGGMEITATTRKHARELLTAA